MKLELKHLAPYLPYALGFLHRGEFFQLLQLNIKYDQKPMWIEGWNGESLISIFPEGCEPLLRPLEEIEENQKLFHQINEPYQYPNFGHFERSVLSGHAPYALVTYLISEHYDVFGLIEKGLAIDLNTVEKS